MFPSSLAAELRRRLLAFCWREWSQMGILAAPPERPSPWSEDAEALIVMSLEIARGEARLFDELLDWMGMNERLLSQRRMRAMCIDAEDAALVAATSGWLAWQRPRVARPAGVEIPRDQLDELFHGGGPIRVLDGSFAAAGFARELLERSGRSVAPDLTAPINFGLRLRAVLGVGIRAEAVRIMLGTEAPLMSAQAIARTSTYSKRNVHDALATLTQARVLESARVSGELRYSIHASAWRALLDYASDEPLPRNLEWGTLFAITRRVLRWSEQASRQDLSDYLLASQARQLLDQLRPDLAYAGVSASAPRNAADAPQTLEQTIRRVLDTISA